MKEEAVRGTLVILLMVLSSYVGMSVLLMPILLTFKIKIQLFQYLVDLCIGFWIKLTIFLVECVGRVRFRFYGDPIITSDRSLIILNHRTRLDWLYLYSILYRFNPKMLNHEKVVLKQGLKKFPCAGWAMQFANYIFLTRNLENDEKIIRNAVNYLASLRVQTKILIFPEGTNLEASTLESSKRFAEKNNLPNYNFVLHPRTTGFVHFVREMQKKFAENGKKLDSIYNLTVGYPTENFAESEIDFMRGRAPGIVDFYSERIPIEKLFENCEAPQTNEKTGKQLYQHLRDRLNEIWAQKEDQLKQYYSADNDCLQNGFSKWAPISEFIYDQAETSPSASPTSVSYASSSPSPPTSSSPPPSPTSTFSTDLYVYVAFWVGIYAVFFYGLFYSTVYLVLLCGFHAFMFYFYFRFNGFDLWICEHFANKSLKKAKTN